MAWRDGRPRDVLPCCVLSLQAFGRVWLPVHARGSRRGMPCFLLAKTFSLLSFKVKCLAYIYIYIWYIRPDCEMSTTPKQAPFLTVTLWGEAAGEHGC